MNGTIFKAYDIRGTYPDQVNEAAFERIAGAYAQFLKPKKVAVGRDVRISGESLQKTVIAALTRAGVDVIDIGICPTEVLYYAVGSLNLDGGIQVSASHNPAEYNGLKLIKSGVEALSGDYGIPQIKELAMGDYVFKSERLGTLTVEDLNDRYLEYIANLVGLKNMKPIKIVANGNFGMSGLLVKRLIEKLKLPVDLIELNCQPDGTFPKGRPDPLLAENQAETSKLVLDQHANMGVAWDADGDRFYVADENGEFIEGCYMTALLAQYLLKNHPGEKVLYDPRNIWAVEHLVKESGGIPLESKSGHAFIKERMKKEGALFAGEMSGHYYYQDFYRADNGLLTFLYFLEIIAASGNKKISDIVKPLRDRFFVSGEINFKVKDIELATRSVREHFKGGKLDTIDGISLNFDNWRFNIRSSNTEPLLRLNVEATSKVVCSEKTELLRDLISAFQ